MNTPDTPAATPTDKLEDHTVDATVFPANNPSRRDRVLDAVGHAFTATASVLRRRALPMAITLALGSGAWWLSQQSQAVPRGHLVVRQGLFGEPKVIRDGRAWVIPGVHQTRVLPAQDFIVQRGDDQAVQTVEGLSVGLAVNLRLALEPGRIGALANSLPDDYEAQLIRPALDGLLYKAVAQHTVRELFSSKRAEIEAQVTQELRQRLAADGLVLKGLQFGAVTLPDDYRHRMEGLLAEGLAAEKMRYTLELKEKMVQQTALEATAQRGRREIEAEAAAREAVIAAKGQEEAMKHVLPFKQRQIEQRNLEAEAERQSRVKLAEGAAQARQIEADGEAKARQKLADAEAYRVAELGKVNAVQMEREGRLITKHPLLIQKTLADKLSDKVRVIIAPPGSGGLVTAGLVDAKPTAAAAAEEPAGESGE